MKDCRKHFGGKDIKAGIINRIAAFISVSLVRFVSCILLTVPPPPSPQLSKS